MATLYLRDVPDPLQLRFKLLCATRGLSIRAEVSRLIEQELAKVDDIDAALLRKVWSRGEATDTSRMIEVYLSVHQLSDLSTKSSCLARLLSALKVVDSSGEIERQED